MVLEDKIGRQEIVDKICGIVDSLKKDENVCVAIDGPWGSGKTFVLNMIEGQLSKTQEYTIIKYDAWENSFYSEPLVSILSCVIDEIKERFPAARKKEKIKRILGRILCWSIHHSSKAELIENVAEGLTEIINDIRNPIETQKFDDFKSYQKLLKEARELLNEIASINKNSNSGKQSKLIILVDEIDRCLPDYQLKVLERIHHLFEVKNCAVIVAMNQDCVANTISTLYGVNGDEYLRKFFDFTFLLNTSAAEYLNSLLEDFAQNFIKLGLPEQQIRAPIRLAYGCLLYSPRRPLRKVDNRELTRYFESAMKICNDFYWKKMSRYYIFFALVALYIRRNISPTFLDENVILNNQKTINDSLYDTPAYLKNRSISYYDYLERFLGINRGNAPKEFKRLYQKVEEEIVNYSDVFNEMVWYSLEKEFPHNEMNRFNNKPLIIPQDCEKLRKLIVLYGGEQQKHKSGATKE